MPPSISCGWMGDDLQAFPPTRRKRHLGTVLPYESTDVFKATVEEEHGLALFEPMHRLDLEGIVAKRNADPYSPKTVWYKVKNPNYSQAEGRGELLNRRRRRG